MPKEISWREIKDHQSETITLVNKEGVKQSVCFMNGQLMVQNKPHIHVYYNENDKRENIKVYINA